MIAEKIVTCAELRLTRLHRASDVLPHTYYFDTLNNWKCSWYTAMPLLNDYLFSGEGSAEERLRPRRIARASSSVLSGHALMF